MKKYRFSLVSLLVLPLYVFADAYVYDATTGDDALVVRLNNMADRIVIVDAVSNSKLGESLLSTNTSVVINGLGGNDSLEVDYSKGDPTSVDGVTFNGGADVDVLKISGTFAELVHHHVSGSSGSIDVDGDGVADISYTGLEPVDITESLATNLVFNLPASDDVALLTNLGGTTNRLASADLPPRFESSDFITPTGALTINGGAGADWVEIMDGITLNGGLNLTSETAVIRAAVNSRDGGIRVDDLLLNPSNATQSAIFTLNGANGAIATTGRIQLGGTTNTASNFWGTINQNDGVVSVGGDLVFGAGAGTDGGNYNLNGGLLSVRGGVVETAAGVDAAQLQLNSGTLIVDNDITVQRFSLGQIASGDFDYTVASNQVLTTTGTTAIGSQGKGYLRLAHSGSMVSSVNSVVGEIAGSSGMASITNGLTWDVQDYLRIGDRGTGVVQVASGTLNAGFGTTGTRGIRLAEQASGVGTLIIGATGGSGVADPLVINQGGNLETGDDGMGQIVMHHGTLRQLSNNIIVGQVRGSNGRFTLLDGLVDVANNLRVGNSSTGLFEQAGGEVRVGANLDFGNNPFAAGTYQMSGGLLTVTNQILVGNLKDGIFVQDGGGIDVKNSMILGVRTNTSGRYEMNAGTLTTFNGVAVGTQGDGLFLMSGGTMDVGGSVSVGNGVDGQGVFTMTNGVLHVGSRTTANLQVGASNTNTTSATVNFLGGEINIAAGLRIADVGAQSSGTLNVGTLDGSLNPVVNLNVSGGGNFEAADNGTGTFHFVSGDIFLPLGNFITGQAESSMAHVTIGGGTAVATLDATGGNGIVDWNVNAGSGDVQILTNGVIRLGRNLNLGTNTNLPTGVKITLDGGSLLLGQGATNNTGVISFRNGGARDQITLRSGLLKSNAGALNFNDATAAQFEWTGGTVEDMRTVNHQALVQLGGTLEVGESGAAGIMIFNQGFSNVAGTVVIDLLGDIPEIGYDQLRVFQQLTLGGNLSVNLGAMLSHGQTYTIVDNRTADPVNGTFAGLPEGAMVPVGDIAMSISYVGGDGNDVVLSPPALTSVGIVPSPFLGSEFQVNFSGLPFTTYIVDYADNTVLPPYNWIEWGPITSGADGIFFIFRTSESDSEIYRARVP